MSVTLQEIQAAFNEAEAEVKMRALNGAMRKKLTMEKVEALFARPGAPEPEPMEGPDKRYVGLSAIMKAYVREPNAAGPRIQRIFARAPQLPVLYGTAEAAESLDLPKSHMYRLRDSGRLPEPVAELANGPVFIGAEIDALAVELRAERQERADKKAAREARAAEKEAKRNAKLG